MSGRDTGAGVPAFLFDLDGALPLAVWRIHRRIGMGGRLFFSALGRETGRSLSRDDIARMQSLRAQAFSRYSSQVRPLPGARESLARAFASRHHCNPLARFRS